MTATLTGASPSPSPSPPPATVLGMNRSVLTVAVVLAVVAAGGGYLAAIEFGGPARAAAPAVVRSMREIRRLETITFHVEKIIDLQDRQSAFFGLIESQDAMLFVAVGEVTAGLDLADLRRDDVRVDRGRVTVRLPRPIILTNRLDNARSYVHARSTGLLARRQEALETRARQQAEREIVQAAIASGILDQAQASAERQLNGLLRSLGASQVAFEWHE